MGSQLNGSIDFYEGNFKMENAMNYGGTLSVEVGPGVFGEFTYSRSDTKGTYRKYLDIISYDYVMVMQYFQLGRSKSVGQGAIKPFGKFSMGAAWFQMKDAGINDEVIFSVALAGGLKIHITDRIGLCIQACLYIYGGGLFLGIGPGGPSVGLSFGSTLLTAQGDFTGGLSFRIGK